MKARHKRTYIVAAILILAGLLWGLPLSLCDDLNLPKPSAPMTMTWLSGGISVGANFAGVQRGTPVGDNGPDGPADHLPQHDAWVDVFSEFNEDKDELISQFEDAKRQYPELILAFRLVATYSTFLELRVRSLSRMRAQTEATRLPPVMDLGHRFRDWTFPPDLCPPYPDPTPGYRWGLTYHELRDMMMEEKLKRYGNPLTLIPTCDSLRAEYQETLDRIESLYQRQFLTSAEMDELYQSIEKLKDLTGKLVAYGCITELNIMVDPNIPISPDG